MVPEIRQVPRLRPRPPRVAAEVWEVRIRAGHLTVTRPRQAVGVLPHPVVQEQALADLHPHQVHELVRPCFSNRDS